MMSSRREFLKKAGLASVALGTGSLETQMPKNDTIKFISPIDGDMLHLYDGTISNGRLSIKVKIKAPSGSRIKVNGVKTRFVDGIYQAEAVLENYENAIQLHDEKSGYKEAIKVFYLKNYINKYRFSFDDNIWFLQDIHNNADRYASLFENPYLGFLKNIHDSYGTKMHFNIYYQTEGFNLSQMTEKFKDEWRRNADWIRLSFHALADKPDRPYIAAGYDQVKKDCDLVKEQIRRFAGTEVMGPVTTLHWGEANVEGCRALRDSGYTVLAGYFNIDDRLAPVSYYLSKEQRHHLYNRFIWRDNREGIIFSRMAIVVNSVKLDQIQQYLDQVKKVHNAPYIDLMIHEQYYYPHYSSYQPDWREKVLTAVKWADANGYKPGFLEESVF
jgi:hypothetical protein